MCTCRPGATPELLISVLISNMADQTWIPPKQAAASAALIKSMLHQSVSVDVNLKIFVVSLLVSRRSMENLHQFFTVSSHTGLLGMNRGPIRHLLRMLNGMMGKSLNMRSCSEEVSRASKMIHVIKEHERKKRKRDRLKRGNVCIMSEAL